jgi:hypothetical protein
MTTGQIHFENRVLRKIFGLREMEKNRVTGDWRKLYNYELHNLYFKVIKSSGMR